MFDHFANNGTIKSNIQAFVLCFDTGTAPAVGYTRTVRAANFNAASISNDWSLLETQAAVLTNIDLIVKGTLDGVRHGLLYQPGANNYKLDTTNAMPFTRAQLVAKIQAGDTLNLTGVPPGAGQRMGIDRDLNGVLDADEPLPKLQIAAAGTRAVLNWPLSAAGFNLEETLDVAPGVWKLTTNAIEISGVQNFTTNAIGNRVKFFRLHQP